MSVEVSRTDETNETIQILHVDDDPDFADLTASFLEREDDRLTVEVETSASDGMAHLEENAVDCVVSDYEMPGTNGLEFLSAVRDVYPDLPFILFTGKGSETVANDAISMDVTDYLQKETGTEQYERLCNRVQNAVEKHHAEHELELKERQFEAVFNSPVTLMGILDPDGTVRRVNDTALEFMGVSSGEVEGKPFPELGVWAHSSELQSNLRDWIERAAAGEFVRFEAGNRAPDGEIVTVDGVIQPVRDDDGTVTHLVCAGRDITTRTDHERELERTANELKIVLDNVPSAVFLIDRAAGTRALSEFGKELLGIEDGSVEGRDPEQFVETSQLPPETAEEIVGMHQQTLSAEKELTAELTIPTSNGTREIHARTVPWYTDSEEPAGVCGVGMDITEQKRRERQLEHERDRLDEFASVVSHDLRSPLQVAVGQVELLREKCDSQRLDDLAQAHDRMDRLIENLLTLAREGEHVDELEAVDLETLTRRCWQNVATAGATVVTTTDQTIRADRRRLQQLVENLVRNAVEHGSTSPGSHTRQDAVEHGSTSPGSHTRQDAVEHGGEAVTVTVTVGDLDDGFYVADDGPGIPADGRDEVFDAGYSTSVDGTGLGRSIVRQVAKAHGWEITVTDSETGGARFEITGVDVETED